MIRTLTWIGIILMTLNLSAQQDVAIGSWKSYLPYKFGWSVTQSQEAVYYGTQWALMKINKDDLSLEYFSKVDGLSDVEVRFVQYYPDQDVLVVIYEYGPPSKRQKAKPIIFFWDTHREGRTDRVDLEAFS